MYKTASGSEIHTMNSYCILAVVRRFTTKLITERPPQTIYHTHSQWRDRVAISPYCQRHDNLREISCYGIEGYLLGENLVHT